jgi:hypothetical protein
MADSQLSQSQSQSPELTEERQLLEECIQSIGNPKEIATIYDWNHLTPIDLEQVKEEVKKFNSRLNNESLTPAARKKYKCMLRMYKCTLHFLEQEDGRTVTTEGYYKRKLGEKILNIKYENPKLKSKIDSNWTPSVSKTIRRRR